jgi:hypothetical protein
MRQSLWGRLLQRRQNAFQRVVREARETLPNGQHRIASEGGNDAAMSNAWFPDGLGAMPFYMQVSGKRSRTVPQQLVDDYEAEYRYLRSEIERSGVSVPYATWQRPGIDVYKALNKAAVAKALWVSFAIPLRYHEGSVYRIRLSADILDDPVWDVMAVEDYVAQSAIHSARVSYALHRAKRQVALLVFLLYLVLAGTYVALTRHYSLILAVLWIGMYVWVFLEPREGLA